MSKTECPKCRDYAEEIAYDNMIDHVGVRIPAAEAKQLGYNMRRALTQAELDEASEWADAWMAEGLLNSLGSDCGNH